MGILARCDLCQGGAEGDSLEKSAIGITKCEPWTIFDESVSFEKKFCAVNDSSCDLCQGVYRVRVFRGAPKVILWKNRRLKSQNVTPGPSLTKLGHFRKCCAVNDSSCAVIYVRGAIV